METKSFEESLKELEVLVHDLEDGEINLDDAIKKYTECEIAVSNMFIDTKNRYGSISYLTGGHVFSAHTDIKEESYNKTKIDVYGGFSKGAHGGMIGDFIKITEYVAKNKSGCP